MKNILLLILLCLSVLTKAQPAHTFIQYTASDGFDRDMVNCILQDRKGFLWLATWDGIIRFDGSAFRTYKSSDEVSGSFISNRISSITEDKYGCIWALGYDKKVSRLHPLTEQFIALAEKDYLAKSLYVLPSGRTWIASENMGILLITTNPENLALQIHKFQENELPSSLKVNQIYADSDGNDWILTDTGLFKYSPDGSITTPFKVSQVFSDMSETENHIYFASGNGQLWRYNKGIDQYEIIKLPTSSPLSVVRALPTGDLFCGTSADGFFITSSEGIPKQHYNTDKGVMRDNQIKGVHIDSKGGLWIQQKTKGVTYYDPQAQKLHYFIVSDKRGTNIIDGRQRQFVLEDKYGHIFVHPSGGGFAYFDSHEKALIPVYNKSIMEGWSQSDYIMYVYMDTQDNIWLSSQVNGLEKVTFKSEQFKLYSPQEWMPEQINSRAAFIDKEERLWIGCVHQGIAIYNKKHHFLGYLQEDGTISKNNNTLRVVPCGMAQDKDGTIWIGIKKHGLIAAHPGGSPNTFRLTRYQTNSEDIYSLSDNDVYHVHKDSQDRLWFATLNGGINYLQRQSDGTCRFINYRNELKNYPAQGYLRTKHITSDQQGYLWLATSNGLIQFPEKFEHPSLLKFNLIQYTPNDSLSLSNNEIQYITPTRQGELFVATFGGGLNKLLTIDNGKARFKTYTKEEGLLSNILMTMGEDGDGNLWISTMEGLCKFNPTTEEIENYTSKEFPEPIRFNEGAGCYSAASGALFFNTQQGLLWFQPEMVHKSVYEPSIVFTQLQLADQVVLPGDESDVLNVTIDDTKQLVLTHKQKSFSIRFAALDLSDSYRISYTYRLQGFEKQWNQAGKNNVANYTNIPKGDYVLEVRSTNSDGVWTDGVRRLPIRILPSFWETPWAYFLYLIIFIIVVLGIVYVLFTFFRLRHEVDMEKKLSELKLKFFTNISHELRTPLTLISAPVKNILEHHTLQPGIQHQLRLVDRNISRMTYLVNQILDFRKIENRKMKMRVQSLELVSFLRHVMGYFESLAEESQITFELETTNTPITVWADIDKLEKIFFNLLANAFKYTPQGREIKVIITEENLDIIVRVCDQGIGISKDKQKHLFERFETAEAANPFNQASTGIGLSLAKELVEMHRGTISLESESDKGSTFIIALKKGKKHFDEKTIFVEVEETSIYTYNTDIASLLTSQKENDSITNQHKEETSETAEEKKTILIVEDNQELRSFLHTFFATDFHVIEAGNGMEGMNQASEQIPDIIISDVMMPEKDGIEMLRELRQNANTSHIPVVLLTSKTAVENQIEGIELGADDYITKPFNADYLKVRIQNILEQRKKLQQYYCNSTLTQELPIDSITSTVTSNTQMFMNRLIKSLNKHLSNGNLKIEDLSQEVGMSRTIFAKKIRSLTGLSPVEYLKETRLKHAAELIRTSDLNMSQIAFQVGFNDSHYFSKCFKIQYGVSPTEYREAHSHLQPPLQ
ncbi:response regulator [Bacteroides sp. 214]|uniref:hybrid sensor histidine kinase/response regulator transcription factor n=1 Tax=Bacteroides sp. 214 TaxID=2302935 RepID=UPI0013D85BC4|nr:hybrid sensor histidine kinase/response regulator transcription factor [Bacteroides sp. 214]NDW12045.1 response regulator [Bacteroides sp. 214]